MEYIIILVRVKHFITPYKNKVCVQVGCNQTYQFSDVMLTIINDNATVSCKSMSFKKTFACGELFEFLVIWFPSGSEMECTLLNVTEPLMCTGM